MTATVDTAPAPAARVEDAATDHQAAATSSASDRQLAIESASPPRPRRWPWWLGLAAIVLVYGGSAWYQVWTSPPYRYIDEQAHVGYVLELQAGRLPTIDTPIDGANGGEALRERLELDPARRRDVWVANNPPLPYLLAAGPAAITRALGWSGGPLIGIRLTNALFMGAAVVVAARLGRNLSGGDQRVGLVAGGLMAAAPHVAFVGGAGFADGVAVFCSLGMLDALVSICRRGPTRRQIIWISLWCAFGAATRPMTGVLAAAVAAMALAVMLWRSRPSNRAPDASQVPGPLFSLAMLGIPAVALSGWWYRRNAVLYGDVTGSTKLLAKFMRPDPQESPLGVFHFAEIWRETSRSLFTRRMEQPMLSDPTWWWPWLRAVLVVVLIAGLGTVVADQLRARRRGVAPRISALGWAAMSGASIVVFAVIAQHWASGGAAHARYAFPVMGALVALIALVAVHFGTRWAGAALIGLLLAIQVREIPVANRFLGDQPLVGASSQLAAPYGPLWGRQAGVVVMALGAVALVATLAMVPRPDAEPVLDGDTARPAVPDPPAASPESALR